MNDPVNRPSHYELPNGLECFDVIVATQGKEAAQNFALCNAIKYLFRHRNKNGVEDVEKARWYLDKYIELEGKHGANRPYGATVRQADRFTPR